MLAAGGIVDREGVRAALEAGALAAVIGTRFLLSEESHAHPEYKRRCLQADSTILTELFGLGWSNAPHRVIANAVTRRWLSEDGQAPRWVRAVNRLDRTTGPAAPGRRPGSGDRRPEGVAAVRELAPADR